MRRTILVAAALCAGLTITGCGGDDEEFTEANLSEELVDAGLLEQEAADCVAESVFADLSDEDIDEVKDADFEEGDIPEALQEALTSAISTCVS